MIAQLNVSFCSSSYYQSGVSEQSHELLQYTKDIRAHNSRTISFGWKESLYQYLVDICSRCKEENWDGYDARPINQNNFYAASILLDLLPDNVGIPDIIPEPTGEIGFEWSKGKDLIFVLSVNPDTITFAGVLGVNKFHGETKFTNELPENIKRMLFDYFILS